MLEVDIFFSISCRFSPAKLSLSFSLYHSPPLSLPLLGNILKSNIRDSIL